MNRVRERCRLSRLAVSVGLLFGIGVLCLSAVLAFSQSAWRKRIPQNNPQSRKVALGRALFFDKRLSIDGTVSCASCHDPAFAFTDSRAVAMGAGGRQGTRNTPTLLNAVFIDFLFWDGRVRSLE